MSKWRVGTDVPTLLGSHRVELKQQEKPVGIGIGEFLKELSVEEGHGWLSCSDVTIDQPFEGGAVEEHWQESLKKLLDSWGKHYTQKLQVDLRVELLASVVSKLSARLTNLEAAKSVIVPIEMFDRADFVVVHPFSVVVAQDGDSFNATFFDANIGTSGDTQEEAVLNLKDLLVATFDQYEELEKEDQLGPEPIKQLRVLRKIIGRVG